MVELRIVKTRNLKRFYRSGILIPLRTSPSRASHSTDRLIITAPILCHLYIASSEITVQLSL